MKTVLYVCVHNAGRSQMAEALTNHFARERDLAVRGESAGTVAGAQINPVAVEVMREIGVSIDGIDGQRAPSNSRKRWPTPPTA
jgi:arsenate reductase